MRAFAGELAQFQVFDSVLDAADITALFNQSGAPAATQEYGAFTFTADTTASSTLSTASLPAGLITWGSIEFTKL